MRYVTREILKLRDILPSHRQTNKMRVMNENYIHITHN
jgi:hypothetical protein